ncbi:MAG: hypothetical protein EPO68_08460, partial [Planctomycetota bacterium]
MGSSPQTVAARRAGADRVRGSVRRRRCTATLRSFVLTACAPLCALAACSAPRSSPLADADVKTTFAFLAARYDGDGDGAIEPREYPRKSEVFAKLDADADGRLTPADFPAERWERDLGIRDMPQDVRERMRARYEARAVVLAYFRAAVIRG